MRNSRSICCLIAMALSTVNAVRAAPSAADLIRAAGVQGGVAVHVGCGDGTLTAALCQGGRFLVHGLDTSPGEVSAARKHIESKGLYGDVCAERFDGRNLPFGDNIVNLLVLEEPGRIAPAEAARVLVPNGAVVGRNVSAMEAAGLRPAGEVDGWAVYRKPWPKGIDQWTHFLYDASGNPVSKDTTMGHPRRLQWFAGPEHTRHHDALASMSAMTSSGGRVFYIYDEGPVSVIHQPPEWKLVARDAFNGRLLWKRDMSMWMTHLYNFRAGPTQLPRLLVSEGDQVYASLGFDAPVTRLDGATGETVLTYEGSVQAEELIYHQGTLLTVKGNPELWVEKSKGAHGYWEMAEHEEPTVDKSIVAYDASSGRQRWTVDGENLKHLVPLSLCAQADRVFYLDNENLHCVDLATGEHRWAAPFKTEGLFLRSYTPTVTVHDDVVLCLYWNSLCGYSIHDGRKLWENKGSVGFGAAGDLFVLDGKVWTFPMRKSVTRASRRNSDGIVTTSVAIPVENFLNNAETGVSIDIHSGKIIDLQPFEHNQHHHRCHRNKATERYFLIGYSGVQLIDRKTKQTATNQWVRGLCQYGMMPANGLLYMPPDPCRCYSNARLLGFFALGESSSTDDIRIASVLERGPAYGRTPANVSREADAWPTYRGGTAREGSTPCEVSGALVTRWTAEIGEGITAPVIDAARVFVAERDGCTVHCLDRATGRRLWAFHANGPVDSPPTVEAGLCVFGCRDGSVYCLDAGSGELAWRFKVSGTERRIGSENRLEAPWAVSGSVLTVDGVVYFAAGRSTFLDGGIRVYGLDLLTGEERYSTVLASGYWGTSPEPEAPVANSRKKKPRRSIKGALVDILSSDGDTISMRNTHWGRTLKPSSRGGALTVSSGFLDSTWFHRQSWRADRASGQLIVRNDAVTCSLKNTHTGLSGSRKGKYQQYNQDGHHHQKFTRYEQEHFPIGVTISGAPSGPRNKDSAYTRWSIQEPFQPRAMVLAGSALYLAGWLDSLAVELKTGRPRSDTSDTNRQPVLRVYSATDGERLAEYQLPSAPVFDGAAAAYGNLFISLKSGTLVCLGGGTE